MTYFKLLFFKSLQFNTHIYAKRFIYIYTHKNTHTRTRVRNFKFWASIMFHFFLELWHTLIFFFFASLQIQKQRPIYLLSFLRYYLHHFCVSKSLRKSLREILFINLFPMEPKNDAERGNLKYRYMTRWPKMCHLT